MDVMLNVNFVVSSNNKDQLRDLYIYLNQNVITATNFLDGSPLGDYLIRSDQVDYMSSALTSTEGVENNDECLAASKVGSIRSLVK